MTVVELEEPSACARDQPACPCSCWACAPNQQAPAVPRRRWLAKITWLPSLLKRPMEWIFTQNWVLWKSQQLLVKFADIFLAAVITLLMPSLAWKHQQHFSKRLPAWTRAHMPPHMHTHAHWINVMKIKMHVWLRPMPKAAFSHKEVLLPPCWIQSKKGKERQQNETQLEGTGPAQPTIWSSFMLFFPYPRRGGGCRCIAPDQLGSSRDAHTPVTEEQGRIAAKGPGACR